MSSRYRAIDTHPYIVDSQEIQSRIQSRNIVKKYDGSGNRGLTRARGNHMLPTPSVIVKDASHGHEWHEWAAN